MLHILFYGTNAKSSTSRHRADALRRLGHMVYVLDPSEVTSSRRRVQSYIDYRSGYCFIQHLFLHHVKSFLEKTKLAFDLVWIDRGEYLSARLIDFMRDKLGCQILLFNVDDPLGSRDWLRFALLRTALQSYDLCVFVRQETSLEALSIGARRVLTVSRSYDEHYHYQAIISKGENLERAISFIGTNIPGEKRAQALRRIMRQGLALVLYGNGWGNFKYSKYFRDSYAGPALGLRAYSDTINHSYISLCLLSHFSRDLVTQRTFEIPASAGLFCAEKTSEHQLLFEDGFEAVLWSTIDECIQQCQSLFDNPERRDIVAANGFASIKQMRLGNEDICNEVLTHLLET